MDVIWEPDEVLPPIVAVLILIYLKRWSIDPLFAIERFLEYCGFRRLVKSLRTINKACTPEDEQKKQMNLIKSCVENKGELDEIIQHELRLLDEKDSWENQKERDGSLNPEIKDSSRIVTEQLKQINPQLRKNGQRFADLQSKWVDGSWTLEFRSTPASYGLKNETKESKSTEDEAKEKHKAKEEKNTDEPKDQEAKLEG
ncbi:uncharacterized protein ASPGLDRAFT_26402 [Aspergillus glaucus CBS 516.65]|uniref:Uncharacterized protein n=1 Tax=Aspergillus glaucus CBS 516.65 TaxID=1160497 RepID=A0A1L9VHU1_ASPGL|nr:hypothetical protein ASPGLDRAFT_26402 [Aspergillus glaucus CBS 516.65]OJJ83498.1 hypothetical protein ASPGLDRAFT_26402 [Aspergillus glaucus CBS 516.65]